MKPLALGIVSDEIAPDFREAVGHGTSWGISAYEIRCLTSGRIPLVDRAELETVHKCVREHSLRITALSPGIFKHPLSNVTELEQELADILPRTLKLAVEFDTPLIIMFGFKREEREPAGNFERAVDYMKRAAALAAHEGVRLAIENEPGFWCDTGTNTRRLIDAVHSPVLGANWDPCNAYGTSETPYPNGYAAIKDVIFNVHVKDTRQGSLIQCVPVGEGVIDWPGQIRALMEDGIVGHITIETHSNPLIEHSHRNVDTLRKMMKANFS